MHKRSENGQGAKIAALTTLMFKHLFCQEKSESMLFESFLFQNCCDTLPQSVPSHKLLAVLFKVHSLQKMKICGAVYSFHSLNNFFLGSRFFWDVIPHH